MRRIVQMMRVRAISHWTVQRTGIVTKSTSRKKPKMESTYTTMENYDQDLEQLQTLADELEEYILGDETYRTIMLPRDKGHERITMSGGQLLSLMNHLLRARAQLTAGQQSRLDGITTQVQQTMAELRTPFHEHLTREAHSHLDRLRWFLDSCQEDGAQCSNDFPAEIQNRQRLEELSQAFGSAMPDEIAGALATVDERIRSLTKDGDFIWPQRSPALYPKESYWYLYVTPVVE